jgi:hypothetical protein
MKIARLSLIAIILLLFGCACAQAESEAKMNQLGAALVHLSSAVESTVHIKKLGADLSDDELLALAAQRDSDLLTPFKGYKLSVLRQSGHAAVLVCTEDGLTALLEDAGCTARMDQHLWKAQPPLPCAFTLNLEAICPK